MPLHIALVGAESTGKSRLGVALLAHLSAQTRLRCALVGEYLREWCEREGRTPRPDEQRAIAEEQWRRAQAAAADRDSGVALTPPASGRRRR